MLKSCQTLHWFLSFFPFGIPLETMKKSSLKELKFCELLDNRKSSFCWKFQLCISCGTKKSAKIPQPGPRWSDPFSMPGLSNCSHFFWIKLVLNLELRHFFMKLLSLERNLGFLWILLEIQNTQLHWNKLINIAKLQPRFYHNQ